MNQKRWRFSFDLNYNEALPNYIKEIKNYLNKSKTTEAMWFIIRNFVRIHKEHQQKHNENIVLRTKVESYEGILKRNNLL